ncbi:MAG TPA: flagellar export protein FliJ [Stellaceae bacterium]|jgi:flagellar export protein FliJ|nr:flagellar export protein FliJ [Stellaceae bacterium]
MTSYQSLADFVGDRADQQQVRWRQVMSQCDEAKRKLVRLRQYAERYRLQMQHHLNDGMEATATMGFLGFIIQIEAVIAKQESEVTRFEQASLQQWQFLVEARRETRMYEILRDKVTAEKLAAALRRSQAEMDEMMGRIVKLL